jgi:hypothetical protein
LISIRPLRISAISNPQQNNQLFGCNRNPDHLSIDLDDLLTLLHVLTEKIDDYRRKIQIFSEEFIIPSGIYTIPNEKFIIPSEKCIIPAGKLMNSAAIC